MPLTSVWTGAGHVGEHQSGRCCHATQKGQREVRGESIPGIPFFEGKYTWFRRIIDLFDRTALVTNLSLELIQLQALEGPETCAIARRVGG